MSTAIITRQTAGTGATVKNAPLTNSEVDTNFISLNVATLPTGGTAGQLLSKIDAGNFNTQWVDNFTTAVKISVKNNTGVTISKGSVVYVSGATGANVLVALAQANSEATSSQTLGFVENDITNGSSGFVIYTGTITGLNTSAYAEGDPVFLSGTTAGGIVVGLANKPVAPTHLVYLGVVTRSNISNGEIQVRVSNGWELSEIHDVLINAKINNDILQYDGVSGLWKNVNTATARTNLGLAIGTDVQAWDADLSSIAGLAGTSGLLRKTAANSWTLDTSVYLTGNQTITVSGDATGSGTTAITLTLANSGVTAGTYTKVTVDAKGRVTVGASLASADLPTYTGTLTSTQVTTALGYTPPQPNNAGLNNLQGYTTTATAAGTTTLTAASSYKQYFTGTTTQTVVMPDVTTLALGRSYEIVNNSTGALTVNSSGGSLIISIPAGISGVVTCIAITGATAASWHYEFASFDTITGSGACVFATSPTLVTPALGTPTSGNFSTGTFTWPTFNQNTTGSAATLTTARTINEVSFNGSANITVPRVKSFDDRTTAPIDATAAYATFAFGSWANNNTSPYADNWILRSYTDASGGNDNMVSFRKDALGMRIWQQTYGSATAFASYKDVAWTDGTNASGSWGISITGSSASCTGNAATATSATTATNLAGGVANQVPYQTGAGASAFIAAPTTASTYLSWNGTGFAWAAAAAASISDDTTTAATYYPTFATATSGVLGSVKVSSTKLTYNPSTGALSATSHVSTSDESLKSNWAALPIDFLEQLAKVKHGTYDHQESPVREVGASAQSLLPVLAEAVHAREDGMLTINYGNAALVAAIKLAERVLQLEARLGKLIEG